MTSFFYVVSYCYLSATLQTMSIIFEAYMKIELLFEFLSQFFKVFIWLSPVDTAFLLTFWRRNYFFNFSTPCI